MAGYIKLVAEKRPYVLKCKIRLLPSISAIAFWVLSSKSYFLVVAEKARMFWSVISMLVGNVGVVLHQLPEGLLAVAQLGFVAGHALLHLIQHFFMACCSISAESLVASTQRATVRWVTSSCISHHLLSPLPYRSWLTRDA